MKIPRFYTEQTLEVRKVIKLPKEIHRHAIQVLRLKAEAALILFNGQGGEYLCQICHIEKRQSQVKVIKFNDINRESTTFTTLALSLIKPEKMDYAIQKSVELGVNNIQPIISERSIIRIKANQIEKKILRWKNIIIAACEQSGRTAIPTIQAPISLETHISQAAKVQRIVMLPKAKHPLSELNLENSIELFIGPEGGFTDQEIILCKKNNIQAIQFGTRILRAETAAIAGLSLLQAYSGNL